MTDHNHVNDIVTLPAVSPPISNESRHDTEDTSPTDNEQEPEVNKTFVNLTQENASLPSLFEELQVAEINSENASRSQNLNSTCVKVEETNGTEETVSKKKVTFPTDSKLVSGFLEPQDPWENGNFSNLIGTYIPSQDKR